MKTKIIFVRHGETDKNRDRIVQGRTQGQLTSLGIVQARKVGLRLKNENIDVIYCSDLKRAMDTAKEIARYHKIKIVYDKRLRERNYGTYEGKTMHSMKRAVKKSKKDMDEFKPRNGENRIDIDSRSKEFFNEILGKHGGKNILIISHGGFMRMTLMRLMNDSNHKKYIHHNTGITIFNIEKVNYKIINTKISKLNCTEHLK